MHGVTKVTLDDVQKEKEQIKQQKKIQLYVTARDKIFCKAQQGTYDLEGLTLTASVLSKNPDIYSFWNYRKKTLTDMRDIVANLDESSKERSDFIQLCQRELDLTEVCLSNNPKSYGAWHHRFWVVKSFLGVKNLDVKAEFKRCDAMLALDERNFHCWDYWRQLCKLTGWTGKEQLDFSRTKIVANFSNYSAWHCRSTLMTKQFAASGPIDVDAFKSECELVLNAIFTDPEDQSAFFYKTWLLSQATRRCDDELKVIEMKVAPVNDRLKIVVVFNSHVTLSSDNTKIDIAEGEKSLGLLEKVLWKAADNSRHFKVWHGDSAGFSPIVHGKHIKLSYKGVVTVLKKDLFFKDSAVDTVRFLPVETDTASTATAKSKEDTSLMREHLIKELQRLSELVKMEPDQKWPLFILTLTMLHLDPQTYGSQIQEALQRLKKIDQLRLGYYDDLEKILSVVKS